jgi:hypothetical protein
MVDFSKKKEIILGTNELSEDPFDYGIFHILSKMKIAAFDLDFSAIAHGTKS